MIQLHAYVFIMSGDTLVDTFVDTFVDTLVDGPATVHVDTPIIGGKKEMFQFI